MPAKSIKLQVIDLLSKYERVVRKLPDSEFKNRANNYYAFFERWFEQIKANQNIAREIPVVRKYFQVDYDSDSSSELSETHMQVEMEYLQKYIWLFLRALQEGQDLSFHPADCEYKFYFVAFKNFINQSENETLKSESLVIANNLKEIFNKLREKYSTNFETEVAHRDALLDALPNQFVDMMNLHAQKVKLLTKTIDTLNKGFIAQDYDEMSFVRGELLDLVNELRTSDLKIILSPMKKQKSFIGKLFSRRVQDEQNSIPLIENIERFATVIESQFVSLPAVSEEKELSSQDTKQDDFKQPHPAEQNIDESDLEPALNIIINTKVETVEIDKMTPGEFSERLSEASERASESARRSSGTFNFDEIREIAEEKSSVQETSSRTPSHGRKLSLSDVNNVLRGHRRQRPISEKFQQNITEEIPAIDTHTRTSSMFSVLSKTEFNYMLQEEFPDELENISEHSSEMSSPRTPS